MLEAIIFALKLGHKIAEARGLVSLKCGRAALLDLGLARVVGLAGTCLGPQGYAESSINL